ncbi:hypothetical protein J5N97_014191 [Dioscorea zingiberensis]|uniref:Uncharacterized protein n=1 Tax=Dioscorea zingiberensis TaxID=325984 RepID=A0A9D5CUC0_9LILI|nr:hypothetical protein J5N97_014191 [Dioscorea zingiberensis]
MIVVMREETSIPISHNPEKDLLGFKLILTTPQGQTLSNFFSGQEGSAKSSLQIPDKQTLNPQASVLMNFWKERICQWKLAQEDISYRSNYQRKLDQMNESSSLDEGNESSPQEVAWDQFEKDEELRQPLSRKVSITSSKISPYRVVVVFRLVALAFFFQFRLVNPVENAYWLWLTSVICEVWFALSWILDQLSKWQPVNRVTYPERLCLRYNQPGNQCQLPCIDVFICVEDPLKESPLVTSNTVLSILAVDYPAERVTCYVSDDGAALLTLETLSETCQFARKWVPFCRKFNIEPRSPECYFSQKVDYLKNNTSSKFAKERRAMKRQYEEFKVQINRLVAKFQNMPCDDIIEPWWTSHAEGRDLPQLVYVSREKLPNRQHNNMAGAMNSLLRVSAILSNGVYVLHLSCNHYINNSKALLEAMCFMLDPNISRKACYVQFPQRFDGVDGSDRFANHNTIFYDIILKGLDGIQGPFYVGSGCLFNRQALYGYYPSSEPRCVLSWRESAGDRLSCKLDSMAPDENCLSDVEANSLEIENPSCFVDLKKCFGPSSTLIASIIVKDNRFSISARPDGFLKEAIHVISCEYEDNTAWGREIGWIYGSLNSDIVTGLKMHTRGWRSIYCMPSRPAFRGTAPVKLSDRLNQVLQWAFGSVDILFSRHCPIWYGYGGKLRLLQRIAYINATIYPLTSIPMVIYCTIPAICLITGRFIIPMISRFGSIWFLLTFSSIFATGVLEMRWSGVGALEWWRNQQFWVIGGVSSHLFAILYGPVKILLGNKAGLTVITDKSVRVVFQEPYVFHWTSLLVMPTSILLINLFAMVAGISSAFSNGYGSWGPLFAKLFFSSWVIIHLYPFLKGLLVRQNRVPTVVVVWSILLASIFSMLWVHLNPFFVRFEGPKTADCGIYC